VELERLRWLEELCMFTNMFRHAPEVAASEAATPAQLDPLLTPRE
jgi:hypothetical protein